MMGITIALPKGRLGEEAEKILLDAKIIEHSIPENSRKLIFYVGNEVRVIILRAWDVPTYVENGIADIGICGKDDLIEHDADVLELLDLKFGFCKMVVAAKEGITKDSLFSKSYLKVATKYPNIAKKFFESISLQAEIIKLYGSVELAAVMNMSDCIVDLVSTGATLKENGLVVIEEIFESSARLIFNRASFYFNLNLFMELQDKLQRVLEKK
jgi:ATP phosphoribosyltransferase